MKNKTLKKLALTAFIGCGILFSTALDNSGAPSIISIENASLQPAPGSRVVKAMIINGEVHPVIDLPVVEITGKLDRCKMVPGQIVDGEIVPSIVLNEVVITPNS